jgi:hypothetical protein
VDTSKLPFPNDREIERWTDNVYLTASYDRQFASDWGINVAVPLVIRPHATIAEDTDSESRSRTHGLGDIRVTARWQGLSTPGGVTAPVRAGAAHRRLSPDLPQRPGTGRSGRSRLATRHRHDPGGDRRLSLSPAGPGLGDGAGQAQIALNASEDYRPGTIGEGSVAVQCAGWAGWCRSCRSMPASTRRTAASMPTWRTAEASRSTSRRALPRRWAGGVGLAHVQLPLYQRVIGWQLAPRVNLAAGLTARF